MENRKTYLFILGGEVVLEEKKDLTIEAIEDMKKIIAEECSCKIEDIEVIEDKPKHDFSDIDVSNEGMYNWTEFDWFFSGVTFTLVEGSDEYLDALNNGTLENFLEFN